MRLGILVFCALQLAGVAPAVAQATGTAVAVDRKAVFKTVNGERNVRYQERVRLGDTIATNKTGQVELEFTDGTRMVIGPNSTMLIEEFLLDSSGGFSKFTANAIGGSFRFFSGKSQKSAYSINTPTATIGIRGTTLDLAVRGDGTASAVVFEGAIEYCEEGAPRGSCPVISTPCSLGTNFTTRQTRVLDESDERDDILLSDFPYIIGENQLTLRPENRVSISSCGESLNRRIAVNRVQRRRDNLNPNLLETRPDTQSDALQSEPPEAPSQPQGGGPGQPPAPPPPTGEF